MDPARLTAALWGNGYAHENDAISYGRQVDRAAARDELVKALGGTWPVQMAKSAVGAAALPGDVYAGRVDPMSQQGIERAADLAGFTTLGSFAAPRPAGSIGMGGMPVKPPTDDVYQVMQSNFNFGRLAGNKTMPIDKLSGGSSMGDAERVKRLAESMSGPDGYISRLIVDQSGNVLEGQHRLDALRQLGVSKVPVTVVEDLARGADTSAMDAAVKSVGGLHPDQRKQIIGNVLEMSADAGSPRKALDAYDLPKSHKEYYKAALGALDPSLIDILRKYGLTGLLGLGAAGGAYQSQTQEGGS